jgi:general secretion pathway protein B
MSYILDALRKSEEKRQRGTVPDLHTIHSAMAKKTGKNRFFSFLLLAILLLNACVVIWWLSPWQLGRQKILSGKDKAAVSKTVTPSPANLTKGDLEEEVSPADTSGQDLPGSLAAQPRVTVRKQFSDSTASLGKRKIDSDTSVLASQASPQQHAPDSGDASPGSERGQRVLSVKELPLSVQKSLPELSISLHYYASSPPSRIVSINDRTMREGEELTAGLKLEEITADGAIFSYQNYRFRVGLKQNLPAE